jgi:cytochrome P450
MKLAQPEHAGAARRGQILSLLQDPESARGRWRLVAELHTLGERHRFADGAEIVYSYRLCQAALRSPLFVKSGEHVSSASSTFTESQRRQIRSESPPDPGKLSALDDPDHSRLRRLVTMAFSARAVEIYRETARDAFNQALSLVDPRKPIDLVASLCQPIPQHVIGQLVGVALPDREAFAELARRNSAGMDPNTDFETHLDSARARQIMFGYIGDVIQAERRSPTQTSLGRLVTLQQASGGISDDELISLVLLLYTAGFRTTVMMLVNGTVELLVNSKAAKSIRSDPGLMRAAADEFLRHEPPVMSVANIAADGAEIDGTPLVPGSRVTALIGAANRDPRVFADPDVFDLGRPRDPQPMSFGFGAHYCLGAALTRIEAEVYFAEITSRFPRMRLVEEPRRVTSFRYNTYGNVAVVLDPA